MNYKIMFFFIPCIISACSTNKVTNNLDIVNRGYLINNSEYGSIVIKTEFKDENKNDFGIKSINSKKVEVVIRKIGQDQYIRKNFDINSNTMSIKIDNLSEGVYQIVSINYLINNITIAKNKILSSFVIKKGITTSIQVSMISLSLTPEQTSDILSVTTSSTPSKIEQQINQDPNLILEDKSQQTPKEFTSKLFLSSFYGDGHNGADIFVTPDQPKINFIGDYFAGLYEPFYDYVNRDYITQTVVGHINFFPSSEIGTPKQGLRMNARQGKFSGSHKLASDLNIYGKGYFSFVRLNTNFSAEQIFYRVPRVPKERKFSFNLENELVTENGKIKIYGSGAVPLEKVQIQGLNENWNTVILGTVISDSNGNYNYELEVKNKSLGIQTLTAVDEITRRRVNQNFEVIKTSGKLEDSIPNFDYSKKTDHNQFKKVTQNASGATTSLGNLKQISTPDGGIYFISDKLDIKADKITIIAQYINSNGDTDLSKSFTYTPTTKLGKYIINGETQNLSFYNFEVLLKNNKFYFHYETRLKDLKSPIGIDKIVLNITDLKGNELVKPQLIDIDKKKFNSIKSKTKLSVNDSGNGLLMYISNPERNIIAIKIENGIISDKKEIKITDSHSKPQDFELFNRKNDFIVKLNNNTTSNDNGSRSYKVIDYNGKQISTYSEMPNLTFVKDENTNETISIAYKPIKKSRNSNSYSVFPNSILFLYDRGAMFDYISGLTKYNKSVDNLVSKNVPILSQEQTSYKNFFIKNPKNGNYYFINGGNILSIINSEGNLVKSLVFKYYKVKTKPTFDSDGNITFISRTLSSNGIENGTYKLYKIDPETLEQKPMSSLVNLEY